MYRQEHMCKEGYLQSETTTVSYYVLYTITCSSTHDKFVYNHTMDIINRYENVMSLIVFTYR